jgi:hypothetical protein
MYIPGGKILIIAGKIYPLTLYYKGHIRLVHDIIRLACMCGGGGVGGTSATCTLTLLLVPGLRRLAIYMYLCFYTIGISTSRYLYVNNYYFYKNMIRHTCSHVVLLVECNELPWL